MSGEMVFIIVSIVLIIAWTAYNISNVRRSTRLRRELERALSKADHPNEDRGA